MESTGSSKAMSVISLVLALAAVIVALALGVRKQPAPKMTDAAREEQVRELKSKCATMDTVLRDQEVLLVELQTRVKRLEAAPKAAAVDTDKAKYVTMDAVLRDQEVLLAELQAKVKQLEAGAKTAPAKPVAAAPTPAADSKVLRTQRIEIVDAAGKVRGVIEVGANGAPAISFLDQDGKVRSEYRLTPSGDARLIFSERDGKRYSLLPIVTETQK